MESISVCAVKWRAIPCAWQSSLGLGIAIPLLFINGEHDEYTSPDDVRVFAKYLSDCQFATIDNTGHFLDMEHKKAWLQSQSVMLKFLQAPARISSSNRPQHDLHHAIAV